MRRAAQSTGAHGNKSHGKTGVSPDVADMGGALEVALSMGGASSPFDGISEDAIEARRQHLTEQRRLVRAAMLTK